MISARIRIPFPGICTMAECEAFFAPFSAPSPTNPSFARRQTGRKASPIQIVAPPLLPDPPRLDHPTVLERDDERDHPAVREVEVVDRLAPVLQELPRRQVDNFETRPRALRSDSS